MNRTFPIPQSHVWFARFSDTVTRAAAPAAASADWIKKGNTPSGSLSVDVQYKERTEIVLGQRVTHAVEIGRKFTGKYSVEEMNKLIIDLIFKSNTTTTDDFISHGSQEAGGWIRFQPYNEKDVNIMLLQGMCMLKPTGDSPLGGEDFFKQDFEAMFMGRLTGKLIDAYPI